MTNQSRFVSSNWCFQLEPIINRLSGGRRTRVERWGSFLSFGSMRNSAGCRIVRFFLFHRRDDKTCEREPGTEVASNAMSCKAAPVSTRNPKRMTRTLPSSVSPAGLVTVPAKPMLLFTVIHPNSQKRTTHSSIQREGFRSRRVCISSGRRLA